MEVAGEFDAVLDTQTDLDSRYRVSVGAQMVKEQAPQAENDVLAGAVADNANTEDDPTDDVVVEHAFARAGLLGNPSDMYNGEVISFALRNFQATASF